MQHHLTSRNFFRSLGTALRRFPLARDGNVAIIFALASLPLFGAMGVAVDYSRAAKAHDTLQSVLDSAVLAGAARPEAQRVGTAQSFFDANYRGADAATRSFASGEDGTFTGTATATVTKTLSRVLGFDDISVSATSVAAIATPTAKVCILLVDPSASQALLANSGAKIDAPECEIHVRSTGSPAAIFNSSVTLDVHRICVKGNTVIQNGGTLANLEKSCDAVADPFAGTMPSVTVPAGCTSGQNFNSDQTTVTWTGGNLCNSNFNNQTTVTLGPGMYQNINFNGSPTINLNPGLYIIKGTVTVNSGAKLNGTGVSFYFADQNSKIQFNGNVTLGVSAPTSGTYANLLFFEPSLGAKSQYVINGTAGSVINGLMYLPSRNVTINSVSNVTANAVTMVFDTLILNNTNWSFESSPREITAGSGGKIVRLVR